MSMCIRQIWFHFGWHRNSITVSSIPCANNLMHTQKDHCHSLQDWNYNTKRFYIASKYLNTANKYSLTYSSYLGAAKHSRKPLLLWPWETKNSPSKVQMRRTSETLLCTSLRVWRSAQSMWSLCRTTRPQVTIFISHHVNMKHNLRKWETKILCHHHLTNKCNNIVQNYQSCLSSRANFPLSKKLTTNKTQD